MVAYPSIAILSPLPLTLRRGRRADRDCARHHPLLSKSNRYPAPPGRSAFPRAGGLAASDCARPASTPSAPARNDQSCVRDARAREAAWPPHARSYGCDARAGGISLAATPLWAKKRGGPPGWRPPPSVSACSFSYLITRSVPILVADVTGGSTRI